MRTLGRLFQSKALRITVGMLGATGVVVGTMYPIAIAPYLHPEEWKQVQKEARSGVDREKIQPGGMRIWSDPFAPLPSKEKK